MADVPGFHENVQSPQTGGRSEALDSYRAQHEHPELHRGMQSTAIGKVDLPTLSVADLSGKSDASNSEGTILKHASEDLGKKVWASSPLAESTDNGKLGAAVAVSEVLKQSGFDVNNARVQGLVEELKLQNWAVKPFDQREPGNVLAYIGSNAANVGIVGEDINNMYSNSARTRQWSVGRIPSYYEQSQLIVLASPKKNIALP